MVSAVGDSLYEAVSMFWETLWALVLGFGLSGAVQAFVSRGQMQAALGDHRPGTVGKASFLGMVSSSCSYAAAALAKSLFARGADFTASMVFMFASTNLVLELGIVLWLLIGWQFALAEFVGGAIMIVLLTVALPRVVPHEWLDAARTQLNGGAQEEGHEHAHRNNNTGGDEHDHHDMGGDDEPEPERRPVRERMRSRAGWSDAAGYTISDLTMLRKELVIGFLVAGFATVLIPTAVWQSLFLTGHGFWSSLENAVLGPLLAILAFVCSIGNVPLAAALWVGGISFGGVIAFVFADLITLPLLLIYRKYYGGRLTLRLLVVFWAIMSIAGLAVEYLFRPLGLIPTTRPRMVAMEGLHWNYTTILNIVALAGFAVLYWLYRTREQHGGGVGYAKDPTCGMQVDISAAPATTVRESQRYYFCSDRCHDAFTTDDHDTTHEDMS
ncbi:permease [Mycolicibacterium hodleri]|uniref:permease n=1 Tax=Mycolicibacterium hodleri TaxID=49897 RepID=UPI001375492B|nr:permease [Mycolicibacterium hodleri]